MNNEVVRVLVTSPLGVGGVTNMMIHIQEHLNRSKINFDYLVFMIGTNLWKTKFFHWEVKSMLPQRIM